MNPRWLKPGDWLAGSGGAVLLVSLFLSWYTVSGRNLTAWQAFSIVDVLLALVALLGLALPVTIAVRRTPAMPIALSVIGSPLAAVAAVVVLIRLFDPPGDNAASSLCAGAWIGLVGVLAVVAGAWWSLRDERNRGVPAPPVEARPAPPAGSDAA